MEGLRLAEEHGFMPGSLLPQLLFMPSQLVSLVFRGKTFLDFVDEEAILLLSGETRRGSLECGVMPVCR